VIRAAAHESILVVAYVRGLIAQLTGVVPDGSVLVIEEPDVAAKRGLHAEVAGLPVVSRLIECPYQLPNALREYLSATIERPVAAIVPGLEYGVLAAADAAANLGLPGAGVQAAAVSRNKYLLRRLAEQAGIANPRHALVESPAQDKAFLAAIGQRCVLKPTARAGSLGVRLVRTPADIDAAWLAASRPSGGPVVPDRGVPSEVLIEEAVTGPEFSVETFVSGHATCFANVTAKHLFPGRVPVERGHDVPARLPDAERRRLVDATVALAEAAKMGDGVLHAEWIMHDGEPVLVECAARLPGDMIPRLIGMAYGFGFIRAYLDVMLGQRPALPARAQRGSAIRFLSPPPGVVTSVSGVPEAADMPGIAEVHLQVGPGDIVPPLASSSDRAGFVLAHSDSAGAAARAAEAALARIKLGTAPLT
jgi:biotin carboxylase